VASGKEVRRLEPTISTLRKFDPPKPGFIFDMAGALAFDASGRHLALEVGDALQLWDTATGERLAEVNTGPLGTRGFSNHLAFSSNGRWLAAVIHSPPHYQLMIYDATTLREVRHIQQTGFPYRISFNSDGHILTENEDAITLWDTESGKQLQQVKLPAPTTLQGHFSHDGKWLATVQDIPDVQDLNSIGFWDLTTGKHAFNLQGIPVRALKWGLWGAQ
jgi:hypothetical protein